tara:strand:+ start:274 stop:915 length:642 start_codon:yes stop_codon:yes gene_type:complete
MLFDFEDKNFNKYLNNFNSKIILNNFDSEKKQKYLILGKLNNELFNNLFHSNHIIYVFENFNQHYTSIKDKFIKENKNKNRDLIIKYMDKIALPYPEKTFSEFVSNTLFYFINFEEAQILIEEIFRVLVPGSNIFIQFFQSEELSLLRKVTHKIIGNNKVNLYNEINYYNYSKIIRLLEPRFKIINFTISETNLEINRKQINKPTVNVSAIRR